MPHKSSQLPPDLYHRLYWHAKRNVAPIRIAVALNLPVKTVQRFIERFKVEKDSGFLKKPEKPAAQSSPKTVKKSDFLDIFIFHKTRYSVVDISGSIDKQQVGKLTEALHKIVSSYRNPLALKMTDVQNIDSTGAEAIISLHAECKQLGRYCAILDPSAAIEPFLKQYGVDKKVSIFGTELGFEGHAFK